MHLNPPFAAPSHSLLGACRTQGRVVSGHKDALDMAQRAAVAKGALKATPLAVSGAFHTPLMKSAQEVLVKVLSKTVNTFGNRSNVVN